MWVCVGERECGSEQRATSSERRKRPGLERETRNEELQAALSLRENKNWLECVIVVSGSRGGRCTVRCEGQRVRVCVCCVVVVEPVPLDIALDGGGWH